jgi:uncharacterized C2H2 Zn-finger protein
MMKKKIVCPGCGKAFLKEKKLHPGKWEKNVRTEIVCECPKCRIIFHEEELGIRLN